MTYCGERALGQRHLVELSRDELERVNYERVVRRLVKATKLQEACEALRAGRALDDADFHELERAVRSVRLRSIVKWHGVTEVTV